MAAKYLKSLTTGVVLPYVEAALKSAEIRLMEPAECAEYEKTLAGGGPKVAEPEPVFDEVVIKPPKPKTKAKAKPKPEPVAEEPAADEKSVDEVLAALGE